MKVYLVFKTAVYRHECGGVFSSIEAADQAAERLIAGEPDDHHSYEVLEFDLDVPSRQTPGGDVVEPNALLSWSRQRGDVSKR